jgi:hypothetical protein
MRPRLIKISLIIIAGFFLIFPNHSQASWAIKDISGVGVYHDHQSIAVDPSDYPHISYEGDSDFNNNVLKHAFFDGKDWNVEVVDDGGTGDAGSCNAIAIDSLGHIHIAYLAFYYSRYLRYAYFDGTKWNITVLSDLPDGEVSCPSIAVDTNNYPHISQVNSAGELRYMKYDGNTWIAETVANGNPSYGTSIALSPSGEVHIAFSDGNLAWANKKVSEDWEINYLDNGLATARNPSIALDSLGNPHVAYYVSYYPFSGFELKYSRYDGVTWQTQTIKDGVELNPRFSCFKLDAQDHPHVCFMVYDPTTGYSLTYAYFNEVEWSYNIIDEGFSLTPPSLALDGHGIPHVSYIDNLRLKYAYLGLALLSPNGGVIPSGFNYTIHWVAPSQTVKFKLSYSTDNGTTWIPINKDFVTGSSYDWVAPTPLGNKKKCLVKLVGYDILNRKVGLDKSDALFTIEVVRLAYPNLRENFASSSTVTITWTTNATKKPVAKTILYYTKDGGLTWNLIQSFKGDPDSKSFEWTVPPVKKLKPMCMIKVVLKDTNGNNVGSDVSDDYFIISPP